VIKGESSQAGFSVINWRFYLKQNWDPRNV